MLNVIHNRKFKLIICTCVIASNQFIIGCAFAFSSILLVKLQESTTSTIDITNEDASWIASVPILICPVGLITFGILTDKIGRRNALKISNIPITVSWLIILNANSLKQIIIGRIILGASLGSGSCAYAYLAEVSPPEYRPLCFSMVTIFAGVGMMFDFLLTMFFHWRTVCGILFAVSVTSLLTLFTVPETPMWLRAKGRIREAEDAERWLCSEPPVRVAAPTADGDRDDCGPNDARWKQLTRPAVWKPALLTVAFFVCQQGSGVYVMLFYSVNVLNDCGVPWDGVTAGAFLAASRVLGSLTYSALHRVKRTTLTVVSSVGMTASLVVVIGYTRMYKDVTDSPYGAVPTVAFVVYVFFAMLAILPLPWTLCGEVFPLAAKGTITGIVQICGYGLMFTVIKIYPLSVSNYGIEKVWSVFTVFCILSTLYGAYIMPETKGKSLDEILLSFESQKKSVKNSLP